MASTPAFTSSFTTSSVPCPSLFLRQKCVRRSRSLHMSVTQQWAPLPASRVSALYTRRSFVSLSGALMGFSAVAHAERAMAADGNVAPSLQALQQIRTRVDDIDALIASAKWDSVRTVLASRPVVAAKDVCNQLLKGAEQDMAGAIVGLREDLMSAIRLLDTSVYANVFIGEDRQILGTKVDYDVPRTYLADVKDALDALIDIASS